MRVWCGVATVNARRTLAVAILSVMCLLLGTHLVGCGTSYGNERPMSMTLREDEFVFHWCGKVAEQYSYLEISYATFTPERNDVVALRAEGDYLFTPGMEFSVSSPPGALHSRTEVSIPVSDERMLFFVNTGASEQELGGVTAIFRPDRPSEMEGRWIYPSGGLHDEPCEMPSAR